MQIIRSDRFFSLDDIYAVCGNEDIEIVETLLDYLVETDGQVYLVYEGMFCFLDELSGPHRSKAYRAVGLVAPYQKLVVESKANGQSDVDETSAEMFFYALMSEASIQDVFATNYTWVNGEVETSYAGWRMSLNAPVKFNRAALLVSATAANFIWSGHGINLNRNSAYQDIVAAASNAAKEIFGEGKAGNKKPLQAAAEEIARRFYRANGRWPTKAEVASNIFKDGTYRTPAGKHYATVGNVMRGFDQTWNDKRKRRQ